MKLQHFQISMLQISAVYKQQIYCTSSLQKISMKIKKRSFIDIRDNTDQNIASKNSNSFRNILPTPKKKYQMKQQSKPEHPEQIYTPSKRSIRIKQVVDKKRRNIHNRTNLERPNHDFQEKDKSNTPNKTDQSSNSKSKNSSISKNQNQRQFLRKNYNMMNKRGKQKQVMRRSSYFKKQMSQVSIESKTRSTKLDSITQSLRIFLTNLKTKSLKESLKIFSNTKFSSSEECIQNLMIQIIDKIRTCPTQQLPSERQKSQQILDNFLPILRINKNKQFSFGDSKPQQNHEKNFQELKKQTIEISRQKERYMKSNEYFKNKVSSLQFDLNQCQKMNTLLEKRLFKVQSQYEEYMEFVEKESSEKKQTIYQCQKEIKIHIQNLSKKQQEIDHLEFYNQELKTSIDNLDKESNQVKQINMREINKREEIKKEQYQIHQNIQKLIEHCKIEENCISNKQ